MTPTANQLKEQYGTWGEHPDYPRADWQYLVANGDTHIGYWEHVANELQFAEAEGK